MVGIVVVSHSARLAEGVLELAREMAGDEVPMAAAGGLDEPGEPLGTDAVRVMTALQEVGEGADGGTLVLMDLGSAVLSAETALDFLDDEARARVRLVAAPLVEGAVAAAAAARAGATLDEAAEEARRGLAGKEAHLGDGPVEGGAEAEADEAGEWLSATAVVGGEHGLHARPAAAVVRAAAGLDADVRLENVTAGRGPAGARSLTALSALGALRGHTVRIRARGPDAAAALEAVAALVGEDGGAAPPPAAAATASPPAAAPAPAPAPGTLLRGVAASPGLASGPARLAGGGALPSPTRRPGRRTRSAPPWPRRATPWPATCATCGRRPPSARAPRPPTSSTPSSCCWRTRTWWAPPRPPSPGAPPPRGPGTTRSARPRPPTPPSTTSTCVREQPISWTSGDGWSSGCRAGSPGRVRRRTSRAS